MRNLTVDKFIDSIKTLMQAALVPVPVSEDNLKRLREFVITPNKL